VTNHHPPRREELGHETKFVIPAAAAAAARLLLRGVARPERPFAGGVVESIYFDDAELRSLGEKLASDYLKTKTRLRWYDGGGAVYLESKQRFGSRRRKLRAKVDLDPEALSRHGLAAAAGAPLARWAAALGVALPADLAPTLHLRYRRERFVAAGGTRLCLDSAIEALAAPPALAARRGPARLADAVFEVKGSARELPRELAALDALGARRASFSKYSACLAALAA